jgi:hypothetical protein
MVVLPSQSRELEPGQGAFEIPPDPFNGAQLRAVGGQAHQAHVLRAGEPLSRMGPPVVQRQAMQAVREGLREAIDEELEHLGVPRGQRQEEAVPRRRLDGAIDIAPLEDVLHAPDGRHAARREAPSADGQSAEATFVLAKHPHGARIRGGNGPLEVFVTAGLEERKSLWSFLCDWDGPL